MGNDLFNNVGEIKRQRLQPELRKRRFYRTRTPWAALLS